jgi:hypothetical protein
VQVAPYRALYLFRTTPPPDTAQRLRGVSAPVDLLYVADTRRRVDKTMAALRFLKGEIGEAAIDTLPDIFWLRLADSIDRHRRGNRLLRQIPARLQRPARPQGPARPRADRIGRQYVDRRSTSAPSTSSPCPSASPSSRRSVAPPETKQAQSSTSRTSTLPPTRLVPTRGSQRCRRRVRRRDRRRGFRREGEGPSLAKSHLQQEGREQAQGPGRSSGAQGRAGGDQKQQDEELKLAPTGWASQDRNRR